MRHFRFTSEELINESKLERDEFGHTVYDDLVGIAKKAFPDRAVEDAVDKVAYNLLRHSSIHRHSSHTGLIHPYTDIIHFSIRGGFEFKLPYAIENLNCIAPREFVRAFKSYERAIAFAIPDYPPENSWNHMQSVLVLCLKK